MTRDADLNLLTGFGKEETFVDLLMKRYQPRYKDARDFALHYRTLLLQDSNGVPFDISLGGLPFEERMMDRSSVWKIGDDHTLWTCSAEDLIVQKAFANRHHDWTDIEGITIRQGFATLDWSLIETELTELIPLKDDPSILGRFADLKNNPKNQS